MFVPDLVAAMIVNILRGEYAGPKSATWIELDQLFLSQSIKRLAAELLRGAFKHINSRFVRVLAPVAGVKCTLVISY